MEFHVDALGPCRKRVTVTVPPERVREEFDRQYDEINENVVLPGFRKGRAPRRLLEKRFGTQLGRDVKEKLVESALERLLEEKKVDPLRPPDIDLEALALAPETAFEFGFEVVTKPDFETPTYKGLHVTVPAVEITDDEIDGAIDGLRRREAVLQTVEGAAAAEGDVLVLDWEAQEGDSVEAHDENAYYPLGRGVIAGFVAPELDASLEGKKAGATVSVAARVAVDDPREELRDKDFQLGVELKEVKRYVLPEVDEAFLQRHDYDDVQEMREDTRKQLQRAHLRERDRLAEETLVGQLVESVEMSLPEEFVEKELEGWARRKRVSLEVEGVDEGEIEKRIDQERADAQSHVEADMRRFFLLDRIAEEEDVKVAEAELLQAIQSIARAYGRPEEEVLHAFRDQGRMAELATQVRHRKAREILRRHAEVAEETAPAKKRAPGRKKKAAPKKKAPKDKG